MKLIYGYLLAALGLIGLAANSTAGRKMIPVLENVSKEYILVPAMVLIVLGIVVLIVMGKSGKPRQEKEEVPIFKGEGKKRKIVGYRVEE